MIITVADMLKDLRDKEEEAIKEFQEDVTNIEHPTIIGDMYEGIAEKLLNKSIFEGLDLRVVSGQIVNENNEKSAQVDCMIVEGEGKNIPNTDHWIYNISQVLAVIEVKKNLYKADLVDSYNKMARIAEIFTPKEMSVNEFRLFSDTFRSAVGMDVPDNNELHNYSFDIQMMYHTLLMETVMPLRIVFGFYGYKDMNSLRNGFTKMLEANVSEDLEHRAKGFGPNSFPSLVFTNNSSLLKLNGIPYNTVMGEDGYWDICTSSVHNPLLHFLEMLWTKLSYKHGITSDIFGEDLDIEGLYRYLRCRAIERKGYKGWEYKYIEVPEDLEIEPFYKSWEPHELNEAEHLLVTWLCNGEVMNTNSGMFEDILQRYNLDEHELLKGLKEKKLVYKDDNNNLELLTDECAVIIKDGKLYAGENRDGKMVKWSLR
ncbi:DUF6602 domain-containing protein [Pontibacillus salipaludis]|uniref:DUF6602 domain-containing protein n=1 Tax=Pontibacillus salipaludis TaxID=1697394 RepID=A0ABQ1Q468_9BACI|nr:DUF6602 domain-containing protein [Pontibacillus salipaludis]GGD12821.1 hypothetical protein GCM10011389_20470 [Pontibacillus salipaludis]